MTPARRHHPRCKLAAFTVLAMTTQTAPAWAADDEVEIPLVPRQKTEITLVPLAGGDSDIGIGGGALSSIARLDKDYKPFIWRLESVAFISFKPTPGGGVEVPFQDYFLKWTVPHLVRNKLRFELRPSFTWLSTMKYFGLGNDSKMDTLASKYNEFGRINPALRSSMRVTLHNNWSLITGATYTQNWLNVEQDSKLAEDMRSGSAAVKNLLGTARTHGVLQFEYGVIYDRRDNEVSTTRGMFHQASVRLSPGGEGLFLPYQYGEGNLTMRVFIPLGTPRLVLAMRGVVDLLFGNAPFYELARYEDTNAIGGGNGVRGVPAQRYYGKAKVFGNVEVRAQIVEARISNKMYKVGVVGFFDAGRVWADYEARPELDGVGLGIKYGVGGGFRIQSGESFVLRADIAWSPDARPIGAYFGAGQMF